MSDNEPIVLDAHDVTRAWNLALALASGDEDGEADLAEAFPRALDMYLQFRNHIGTGGVVIDDGTREWTSAWKGDKLVLTPGQPAKQVAKGKKKG